MSGNFSQSPSPWLQQVVSVLQQVFSSLDIPDHEEALCSYLDHYGLEHEHIDDQIIVLGEDGEPVLTATFDEQKRLTSLEAQAGNSDGNMPAENTITENKPEANKPPEKIPVESRPEQNTAAETNPELHKPPEKSQGGNSPEQVRTAGTPPAESWDEAQLRRMLGG